VAHRLCPLRRRDARLDAAFGAGAIDLAAVPGAQPCVLEARTRLPAAADANAGGSGSTDEDDVTTPTPASEGARDLLRRAAGPYSAIAACWRGRSAT